MFNYQEFKKYLSNHIEQSKREGFNTYIELFGDKNDIKEEPFYVNYLSAFEPIGYNTPIHMDDEFDWDLLIMIVAASFSSRFEFEFISSDSKPELTIYVNVIDRSVVRKMSGIWSPFAVLKLFYIYLEELMNMEIFIETYDEERDDILKKRRILIDEYVYKVTNLQDLYKYDKHIQQVYYRIERMLKVR